MNGGQDLGGMHGLGPVAPEPNEPVFHADWEKRVFALAMAMGFTGAWTLDGSRAARESMPPADYLRASYYAIWLDALERQLAAHGLARPEEIARGVADPDPAPVARVLTADILEPRYRAGFPSDRPAPAPARFAVGDAVTMRNIHPPTHTRLPRYVRAKSGTVLRVHGAFVLPDTNAYGQGEHPDWLYTVAFPAAELWGEDADPNGRVTVAVFERYIAGGAA
ncbi:nitrile hydratase subunit beta [Methylobacterium sp. J-059]|uniref:nitrile hydratase subunit beta n=1 Tax=Methylobacterium sp. J-059 TaxID=2836643 RepID=UPI001FB89A73|nr:nitrile hydratase subunit beta [Methylobacterium sp. J-059]MCJ2042599.1 nitrile hydratase subunit beta [Methylobacterium sp. J-059]